MKYYTTCVGVIYPDGVIVAVDQKAIGVKTGKEKRVDKIVDFHPYLVGAECGKRTQCEAHIHNYLTIEAKTQWALTGAYSAMDAATDLEKRLKSYPLDKDVGCLIAGFHPVTQRKQLYLAYPNNAIPYPTWTAIGSGAKIARGFIQPHYSSTLTEAEACELAEKAIFLTAQLDIGTGVGVTVVRLDRNGWQRISDNPIEQLEKKYLWQQLPFAP